MEAETRIRSSAPSASVAHRGRVKAVRATIKLVLTVLILGYLLIWIMMPTNTYKKSWLPKLRAKLNNTTYLETQGTNLLIFTLWVLSFVVLGAVYLHLGERLKSDDMKKDPMESWRGLVIVRGPLGIVSGIELSFFAMFVALLVWSLSTLLFNSYSMITPQAAAEHGEKVLQLKLKSAGLRLGLVGNIGLAFLFFPVTRASSVLPVFGLTSEGSIKYHIWLGHIVMLLFTAHGLANVIYWSELDS